MRKFNVFDAPMSYDQTDPEPYAAGKNRFGPKIGASRLGATVYELPPGKSLCPYHYGTPLALNCSGIAGGRQQKGPGPCEAEPRYCFSLGRRCDEGATADAPLSS